MPPPECSTCGEEGLFSRYRPDQQTCGGAVGSGVVALQQHRNSQLDVQQPLPPLSGPHFLSSSSAAPEAAPALISMNIEDRVEDLHLRSKDQKAAAAEEATPAGDDPEGTCPNNNNNNNNNRTQRDASPPTPRLDLPFRNFALCDRENEARQLAQALDRGCWGCRGTCSLERPEGIAWEHPSDIPAGSPHRSALGGGGELVLVTGPSGCGKTCLVESVVRSALQGGGGVSGEERIDRDAPSGGALISGKFDQLERREQYYAIIQALTEYALIVSRKSSPSQLHSVRTALAPHRETVKIVADLVPEILTLLDLDDSDLESNE
jgi:AAA ATPase domain